jgi:hypothetical protein
LRSLERLPSSKTCSNSGIAVISQGLDCREKIGRLVDVRGPMRVNEAGPSWRIRPITPELYALHESNHVMCREQVTWGSGITHLDACMMPVRLGQEADGAQTGETGSAPAPAPAVAASFV